MLPKLIKVAIQKLMLLKTNEEILTSISGIRKRPRVNHNRMKATNTFNKQYQ